MNDKKLFYSVKEVAELLSVSDNTVKSWIYRTKQLKAVKVGGAVRISREEIERLIKPIE